MRCVAHLISPLRFRGGSDFCTLLSRSAADLASSPSLIAISASASFANEVPRVGHGDPLLEVVLRHQIGQVVAMFPRRPEGMRGFRLPVFRSCSYDKLHLIARSIEVVVARSQAACCFPIQAMSLNALPHARTVLASTLEPTEIPDAKRGNWRSVSR